MKLRVSLASIVLLGACAPVLAGQNSTAQKLAALRNLRDTGVITDADYQQRAAALKGGATQASAADPESAAKLAALKNLRDTGVLTAAQYQQRVAALKAGSPAVAPAPPAPSRQAAGNGPHTDPLHLGSPTVPHTVADPQWGVPWGTVKLPPNWTLTSQMVHAGPNGCSAMGHGPLIVMDSPDKTVGMAIFPILKSAWMQGPGFNMQQMKQQGCFVMPSLHAADFATKILLPTIHKGARFQVVSSAPDPNQNGMADHIRQFNAQVPMLTSQNFQNERTVETARVFARFDENGQKMMEVVSLTLSCQHTRYRQMMANMPGMETADCTAWNVMMMKVPDDGSDPTQAKADPNVKPFFAIEPNAAWGRKLQEVNARENEAQRQQSQATAAASSNALNESIKRQQIMHQGQVDRSNAINNNYARTQAANDQVQQGRVDYLSSSHDYHDPTTGQTVNLSNQYNHTYFDGQGHALQTNSAYSPGVDWTEASH